MRPRSGDPPRGRSGAAARPAGRQASQKSSTAPSGWISSSVGLVPAGRPVRRWCSSSVIASARGAEQEARHRGRVGFGTLDLHHVRCVRQQREARLGDGAGDRRLGDGGRAGTRSTAGWSRKPAVNRRSRSARARPPCRRARRQGRARAAWAAPLRRNRRRSRKGREPRRHPGGAGRGPAPPCRRRTGRPRPPVCRRPAGWLRRRHRRSPRLGAGGRPRARDHGRQGRG
jgi:hypothetical protein